MTYIAAPLLRRTFALVILSAILATLWGGIVVPCVDVWRNQRSQTEHLDKLLAGYRAMVAARPALEATVGALRARDAAQQGFLGSENYTLTGAKLQSDVKRLVEGHAGQVTSIQLLPMASESSFQKMTVRVDFKTSTDDLPKLAYAVETASPVLFIENVIIRAPENSLTQAASAAAHLDLTVRWDVYGYARGKQP
jgi:general secretion pathway protein M